MAKQQPAPPRLSTLVDEIMMASKLSGSPVLQKDMARTLRMRPTHFSSLIRKDREGSVLPRNIESNIKALQRNYARYLKDLVTFEEDKNETISIFGEKIILLECELSGMKTFLKQLLSEEQWGEMQAAIEADKERRLDEVQARKNLS